MKRASLVALVVALLQFSQFLLYQRTLATLRATIAVQDAAIADYGKALRDAADALDERDEDARLADSLRVRWSTTAERCVGVLRATYAVLGHQLGQ